MIKFLIIFGVGYFAYRLLKSWMTENSSLPKTDANKSAAEIEDVMIKDPFCEVYFPKRTGVHLKFQGEDLFFCSTECKDKFVASCSEN